MLAGNSCLHLFPYFYINNTDADNVFCSLRKHVRTVCSPRDSSELYECDICKRKYRLKGALKDHMNKHSRKS